MPDMCFANSRTASSERFSVTWLRSCGIGVAVLGAGQGTGVFSLSHTFSFQGDAVGVVNDPVENGIGDRGLANHVVPFGDGQLGGDERRFAPVALFEGVADR